MSFLVVEAKPPSVAVTRTLREYNTASARLAVVMGMREGQEILDFDRNDEVALSRNLEKLFRDKGHDDLASSQAKVRGQYVEIHRAFDELSAKLEKLSDELRVDVEKLKAGLGTGMVAIKANKLSMPRASKKDGPKTKGPDKTPNHPANPGTGPVVQPADVVVETPESE
jgi:hypothetical protein